MRYLCLGAAALLAVGCAGGEKADDTTAAAAATSATPADDRARTAASLANAIAAKPAAADSILRSAGYTRDSFQALMYEIAADSTLSAAYAATKTR